MRWLLHIIFWVLVWLWMTVVYVYNTNDLPGFLAYSLQRMPVIILATYAVIRLVVKKQLLTAEPSYKKAATNFAAIILIAVLLDRAVLSIPLSSPTVNGEELYYEFFLSLPVLKNAFLLLSIVTFGATIEFLRGYAKSQRELFQLRNEKLESELAFLKNQINPHFLFNMFNNLFAMAQAQGNHELASGLSGMSKLMRYLTYDSNVPKISLEKEIALIESYISLQQIRFTDEDDISIVFRVNGDVQGKVIAPVLLLPVIENAFKHGQAPGHSANIQIILNAEHEYLNVLVKNKKFRQTHEPGIGLQNLARRLNLIHPGKHTLAINDSADHFEVKLKIPLIT